MSGRVLRGVALLIAIASSALAVDTVRIVPVINPPPGTSVHGAAELQVSGTSTVRDLDGKDPITRPT